MSLVEQLPREIGVESLKATPATGWLVAKTAGWSITADDLATYLAIAFLTMQIGWFLWDKLHRKKKGRGSR